METFEKKYYWLADLEKLPDVTKEELETIREVKEIHKKHPDLPLSKPIEVLNLIMKREFAEEIVRGEKILEFRSVSDFYWKRLVDKEMDEYLLKHTDDKLLMKHFPIGIRPVHRIHFFNYNKTWSLDVEVLENWILTIDKVGIEILHKEYNCNDWDEVYEDAKKAGDNLYPQIFYFHVGKILERNNI